MTTTTIHIWCCLCMWYFPSREWRILVCFERENILCMEGSCNKWLYNIERALRLCGYCPNHYGPLESLPNTTHEWVRASRRWWATSIIAYERSFDYADSAVFYCKRRATLFEQEPITYNMAFTNHRRWSDVSNYFACN